MSDGSSKKEGKVSFMIKRARTHRNNLMMMVVLCNAQRGMASIERNEIGEMEEKVKDD